METYTGIKWDRVNKQQRARGVVCHDCAERYYVGDRRCLISQTAPLHGGDGVYRTKIRGVCLKCAAVLGHHPPLQATTHQQHKEQVSMIAARNELVNDVATLELKLVEKQQALKDLEEKLGPPKRVNSSIWKLQDDRETAICDLDDQHLINIINMLENKHATIVRRLSAYQFLFEDEGHQGFIDHIQAATQLLEKNGPIHPLYEELKDE